MCCKSSTVTFVLIQVVFVVISAFVLANCVWVIDKSETHFLKPINILDTCSMYVDVSSGDDGMSTLLVLLELVDKILEELLVEWLLKLVFKLGRIKVLFVLELLSEIEVLEIVVGK